MGAPLRMLMPLLLLVALAGAAKLPSSMKTCKQTDPDFSGCLSKAIMDSVPTLKKGIPSLGLPPIDPLHFTQIKIKDTPDRPVSLSLEFNEADISGFGNGVIDSLEMKPGSYNLKCKIHCDTPFRLTGPYKADGKVLVLPIKGEGMSNITATGLKADLEMIGQPIERDGEKYWDVTDFKVDIEVEKLLIDFTGLYNNDKALGERLHVLTLLGACGTQCRFGAVAHFTADNTLKFLNENSEEISKELMPAIGEALSATFKELAKRVFDKVPYNSVFPPS